MWYLRVKEPDRPRPFRAPLVPLVPILGIRVCGYMMSHLPAEAWQRLLTWLAIGLLIYFLYSRHHSVLHRSGISMDVVVPQEPTFTDEQS